MDADKKAAAIAARRADHFESPFERQVFLSAFALGRRFAVTGQDSSRELRRALDADESITVAGLLEGLASVPRPGNLRLEEMDRQQYRPQHMPRTVYLVQEHRRERGPGRLTDYQLKYLKDAAYGLTAAQSARKNGTTVNTVNAALRECRVCLGASNTLNAVILAVSTGQMTIEAIDTEGSE